jgi:hypothetical protein
MKFPNYLKNAFAGLGIVSLIFYTCAAADEIASDNNDNNPPSMSSGVYQVEAIDGTNIIVLNTETGVIKTYHSNNISDGEWAEGNYIGNGLIGSGNLTVTH